MEETAADTDTYARPLFYGYQGDRFDVSGFEHHHIHSTDGLKCYGDYSKEGFGDVRKHYEGRDDRVIVRLDHCIYPCTTVEANRRDHNIALLSEVW